MDPDRTMPRDVRPHAARQIEELCREFERRWRSGGRPEVGEYLRRVEDPQRGALLGELVALEVEYRRQGSESVTLDEYRRRFPEYADQLEAAWTSIVGYRSRDTRAELAANRSRNTDVELDGAPPATPQADPQASPRQIGRYEIRQLLGQGGFGTVYLAHDPKLERLVALKVPSQRWLSSPHHREMYLQEARAAAQLKHPGLVAVYDVQEDADSFYIVQEFIDGPHLGAWQQTTRPDAQQIVERMIEIAEAIGYAHQQGLVHRDLKPANILIDRQCHAHVADFGLALQESLQQLRQGDVSGTPAYMSPEQVRGESHRLDGRTDIWSMGVILYELLAGTRPFAMRNQEQLMDAIQYAEPKPLRQFVPQLSKELARICMTCLAKRIVDRYQATADFVEDLKKWLNGARGGNTTTAFGDLADNTPIDNLGETNQLLKPMWRQIDNDLRKIFIVAATLAEMEGKNYVSTTNFVKALMFLRPGKISDFFGRLPQGALPESIPDDVPLHVSALQSLGSFSPCINSALTNLTPKVSSDERLSSEDVFIDIARYATGKSTQRLRSHGVSKQDVEKIVKQLGWQLVERDVVKGE